MGIRAWLAALAACLLVPLLLLSTWNLERLADARRSAALRDVLDQAREVSRALDDELAAAEIALRMLAASPSLASGDIAGFRGQVSGARIPEGSALRLVCAAGFTSSASGSDEHPVAGEPNGERSTIVVTPQSAVPQDAGSARRPRGFAIDVPVAMVTGGDACRLAFSFEAEALQRWIAERRVPEHWRVIVLDAGFAPLAQQPVMRAPDMPVARSLLRDAVLRNGEGHLLSRDAGGSERYDVYTRSGRTGWFVDIAVPAAAIDASAPSRWAAAAIGTAIALAAVALLVLGQCLRRSATSLAGAASALGREGKLPPHVGSVHELDALRTSIEHAHADLERERHARAGIEADRTQELLTEREARETAELQNRAKDHFIAMLGHELRNPLNAISGASAILSGLPAANPAQAHACDVVARQTRHLSRIVDDLADLGRLMTGKVPLEFESVDLAELCRHTVARMRSAGRIAADTASVHAEPAWVEADRIRLEQAVGILIASAMRPGSHDAQVELRVVRDPRQASLYVRSMGPGIPERLSANPVDAPGANELSLDPTEGGPSIGLGIVERIVQMHGGRVEIRFARRGRGGEFIVRLPVGEAHTPVAANHPQRATTRHKLRVLVVDDHDDSRAMLRILLQQSGHETIEAMDGIEGVQLALASRPDAAIVDIGLPGIDGYEVARRLRKLPHGARLALIALTGYGQVEDKERALRAGFDEHLVKPLDAQRLEAALTLAAPTAADDGADGDPT